MRFSLILFLTILLLQGCKNLNSYEHNIDIENSIWSYGDSKSFEVEIPDTHSHYLPYINIKYHNNYRYRNIWVKAKIYMPSGKILERNINVRLARETGRWLGYREWQVFNFGELTHVQQNLESENDWFPETGLYKITLEQDMRNANIKYISSVGLKIIREDKIKKR